MLVQVNPQAGLTTVVSIPRDLWVALPSCAGGGEFKFNAAYDRGGLNCMVTMVQNLTGVKVDHVVVFDFNAFKELIGVLGGVQVCVNSPIYDRYTRLSLKAGKNTLGPEQALAFARSRRSTADGSDLARIDRQQYLIKRILAEVRTAKLGPVGAARVAQAMTPHLVVDQKLDLGEMAQLGLSALSGQLAIRTLPYYFSNYIPWGSVAFGAQAAKPLLEELRNPSREPVPRPSRPPGAAPRPMSCVD